VTTTSQLDLGLQYNFANASRPLVPYLTAAVTGRAITANLETQGGDSELEYSGGGLTLGGGLQYFFTAPLAFNAGLSFTFGEFDNLEIDGEEVSDAEGQSASGARLHLGLTWYPMVRR